MAVSTIKPAGGGDYTNLALWAIAKKFSGGVEDAQCFVGNCGVLNVTDWSPPSSTIFADASAKHNGIDSGTAGIAFSPKISIGGGVAWVLQDLYLTRALVYDIRLNGNISFVAERCMIVNATNTDTTLFKVATGDDASAPVAATTFLRNCILLMKTGSTATTFISGECISNSENGFSNFLDFHADNSSCYAETSPANGLILALTTGADVTEEVELQVGIGNTAIFGPTTCFNVTPTLTGAGFHTFSGFDFINNASSDATAVGTGCLVNQVASDWFASVPSDLRLKPASPGKDAGATLTNVPTDIIGTARPQGSAWDIGAFETVQSTGGILGWLRIF